jgi:hypothetical protein
MSFQNAFIAIRYVLKLVKYILYQPKQNYFLLAHSDVIQKITVLLIATINTMDLFIYLFNDAVVVQMIHYQRGPDD